MTTLTVTAKGQVTLKKEVLRHLGVKAGDRLDLNLSPGPSVTSSPERRTGTWNDVYGILAGETDKVATIEEMNEAIRKGWAGQLK